jgi:hypothetical protein
MIIKGEWNEMEQLQRQLFAAIEAVNNYFNDPEKSLLWMILKNPLFGNISPKEMIMLGRYDKVMELIKASLDENER